MTQRTRHTCGERYGVEYGSRQFSHAQVTSDIAQSMMMLKEVRRPTPLPTTHPS